ncbi:MAG: MATE family efflux transporter [Thomasclavelia ramosa]|nr:MATE family efflux transporter [Thomasclavelia ramosa]
MKELDLGSEKLGSLVRRFSIPCVISMVVAALYNIVDQIFIGWSEAGAFGNAATNIVYPFTVLALGLALLIGDGAAAGFSISLGQGNKKQSNKNIGNGFTLLIIISLILCIIGFICRVQILGLFGGNPNEVECYGYATDYYKIICIGMPFYMIGQGLNGAIRADGSPKFAMGCTLVGAITNLVFDPLLIFGFNMGVKGAAIATILGQIITFLMSIFYLTRAKNFKINKEGMTLDKTTVMKIISVGMASLIVQLSIVVIIAVNNNLLTKYGYETFASTGVAYGAVTPLAVVGIVMKVFGIVVSIVIGISLGGQPIIGFNMGAGNMERVKETIQLITQLVIGVGVLSFLLFEFAPDVIIFLFGSHNTPEYMEYAKLCIRIFLGGIILTCYIKSAAIILQSMGNSMKSTVLALLRDVIIFVPASIIIASITRSIVTMLWAAIISDIIAAIIGFILVQSEIKKCEKLIDR